MYYIIKFVFYGHKSGEELCELTFDDGQLVPSWDNLHEAS